jgi:predicted transcriptional regulator
MATSIKLPQELSARIARVAKKRGLSSHAFMLETLAAGTTAAEKRQAFIDAALRSKAKVEETGIVYEAEPVFEYLRARARGERVKRPPPTRRRR